MYCITDIGGDSDEDGEGGEGDADDDGRWGTSQWETLQPAQSWSPSSFTTLPLTVSSLTWAGKAETTQRQPNV